MTKDLPLARIANFMHTVTPFDTLNEDELAQVISQMEIAYYPRGEVIMRRGDRLPDHLYIVQAGSVRITVTDEKGEETLVDIRGEGDVFGATSLLQGTKSLFDIGAQEDVIAYLLPAERFKELVNTYPVFERYFSFSLARVIEAVHRSADSQAEMARAAALGLDEALVGRDVSDLMVTDVLTCGPETPIRIAAQRMAERRVGSIVIMGKTGRPLGIFTDSDLRSKVVARGNDFESPVTEMMNQPLHTVNPDASAFDALLEMSRYGVHHLLVTENNRLVGIISDHDLQMEIGSSPVGLIQDIERAQSVDELIGLHPKVDRVVEVLLRQGWSAKKMTDLVTQFNDRVILNLLKLTEREFEIEGLGRPPVPYCWIALGSEGRREQTLRTDQDNAIMFANVPVKEETEVKRWFLLFSKRVVKGLVSCGFPRCVGGIMASNPKWCQTESQWQETFLDWVNDPNPVTLMMVSIFFDFRPIYAQSEFPDALRERLHQAIRHSKSFLPFMAKNSLRETPPLGFLRQFVVEKSGEHKNEVNLKLRGLNPVVNSARVLALDLRVNTTNTLERLEEIEGRGIIDELFAADLREAYSFIALLRITRHLEARAAGQQPDNFVNPGTLNSFQRKMLKESFAVISRLQEVVKFRYQTFALGG